MPEMRMIGESALGFLALQATKGRAAAWLVQEDKYKLTKSSDEKG